MKNQEKPEIAEEKSNNIGPGVYIFQNHGEVPIMTKIPTEYPGIYLTGYIEKTPNPGGGENVFFG